MDTQTLELVGQHRLASELLLAGLEVAFPARDRGVDLIAYLEIGDSGRFIGRPIQLKASSRRSFGVLRKYERINDLVFAYVWHCDGEQPPETYALTYAEAVGVAEVLGWTETESWKVHGGYGTTKPTEALRQLLMPFKMGRAEDWVRKVLP